MKFNRKKKEQMTNSMMYLFQFQICINLKKINCFNKKKISKLFYISSKKKLNLIFREDAAIVLNIYGENNFKQRTMICKKILQFFFLLKKNY